MSYSTLEICRRVPRFTPEKNRATLPPRSGGGSLDTRARARRRPARDSAARLVAPGRRAEARRAARVACRVPRTRRRSRRRIERDHDLDASRRWLRHPHALDATSVPQHARAAEVDAAAPTATMPSRHRSGLVRSASNSALSSLTVELRSSGRPPGAGRSARGIECRRGRYRASRGPGTMSPPGVEHGERSPCFSTRNGVGGRSGPR